MIASPTAEPILDAHPYVVALDDDLHRVEATLIDIGDRYLVRANFATSRIRRRQLGIAATAVLRRIGDAFRETKPIEWIFSDQRGRQACIRFTRETPDAAHWLRGPFDLCDVSIFHDPECITRRGRRRN